MVELLTKVIGRVCCAVAPLGREKEEEQEAGTEEERDRLRCLDLPTRRSSLSRTSSMATARANMLEGRLKSVSAGPGLPGGRNSLRGNCLLLWKEPEFSGG